MFLMNNLISIGLGLLAWALPIVYLAVKKRRELFCCGSLSVCALSLAFQLREVMRLADKHDYAAIEDTINGVNFCAVTLLSITLVLNVIALLRKEQ